MAIRREGLTPLAAVAILAKRPGYSLGFRSSLISS